MKGVEFLLRIGMILATVAYFIGVMRDQVKQKDSSNISLWGCSLVWVANPEWKQFPWMDQVDNRCRMWRTTRRTGKQKMSSSQGWGFRNWEERFDSSVRQWEHSIKNHIRGASHHLSHSQSAVINAGFRHGSWMETELNGLFCDGKSAFQLLKGVFVGNHKSSIPVGFHFCDNGCSEQIMNSIAKANDHQKVVCGNSELDS